MSGAFNGRAATVGTSGTGAMGKTPMKIPTVNNPYVLRFYSLRSYKEAKIFNPMLGPRICRLEKEPLIVQIVQVGPGCQAY